VHGSEYTEIQRRILGECGGKPGPGGACGAARVALGTRLDAGEAQQASLGTHADIAKAAEEEKHRKPAASALAALGYGLFMELLRAVP
jgi:hypothetical protein